MNNNQFDVIIGDEFKKGPTKSSNIEEISYFNRNIQPQILPQNFDMTFSGRIRGRIEPCDFMNCLCHIIKEMFGENNCYIDINIDELKFNAIFENEENNENTTIEIKLYKSNNDEFVLKFTNINGSFQNFISKFHDISELIRKIYN